LDFEAQNSFDLTVALYWTRIGAEWWVL